MRQANFKPEVNLHTCLIFKGEIINKKSKGTKQAEASEEVRGLTRHIILAIKKQMPNHSPTEDPWPLQPQLYKFNEPLPTVCKGIFARLKLHLKVFSHV